MERKLLMFFGMVLICIVSTADLSQSLSASEITNEGCESANEDSESIEYVSGMKNWHQRVELTSMEEENCKNTYVRDFVGFGKVGKDQILQYTAWGLGKRANKLQYWQTDSQGCSNVASCRRVLSNIEITRGHRLQDDFHILPDGSVIEGVTRWVKNVTNNDSYRINLLTKSCESLPSLPALVTLAIFVRDFVAAGLLSWDFGLKYPPHASDLLNSEIRRWVKMYHKMENGISFPRLSLLSLNTVSRLEWKAKNSIREFKESKLADLVVVNTTASVCRTNEQCAQYVRDLQREQIPLYSDIFPNFIIGRDGRIYEGLGWESSRKENVMFFAIPEEGDAIVPKSQVLMAFALLLQMGVDFGRIKDSCIINVDPSISPITKEEIVRWGVMAKSTEDIRGRYTYYFQPHAGGDNITKSRKIEDSLRQLGAKPLTNNVRRIRCRQTKTSTCGNKTDCLPFFKCLEYKCWRSIQDVKSNFYFLIDGDKKCMIRVGLGWDLILYQNEIIFEFITADGESLPSHELLEVSAFVIREGIRKNKIKSDYRIIVDKDATIEFENWVRPLDNSYLES